MHLRTNSDYFPLHHNYLFFITESGVFTEGYELNAHITQLNLRLQGVVCGTLSVPTAQANQFQHFHDSDR
jgi:hypothetical protein